MFDDTCNFRYVFYRSNKDYYYYYYYYYYLLTLTAEGTNLCLRLGTFSKVEFCLQMSFVSPKRTQVHCTLNLSCERCFKKVISQFSMELSQVNLKMRFSKNKCENNISHDIKLLLKQTIPACSTPCAHHPTLRWRSHCPI